MHTLLAELQPASSTSRRAAAGAPARHSRRRARVEGHREAHRIFQPERRSAPAEHFGVVAAAVLRRSRLWIRPLNRKTNRETEREISRSAWCTTGQLVRRRLLPRARSAAQLRGRRHPRPELRDAARRKSRRRAGRAPGAGYGIFAGREVQWASLRFTPEAARWVAAQAGTRSSASRFDHDGSYLLEVPYSPRPGAA